MKKLNELCGQIKQAFDNVKQEIQSLDSIISAKRREIDNILAAPISKEDYLCFMDEQIKQCAKRFPMNLERQLKSYPLTLPHLLRAQQAGTATPYVFVPSEDYFFYYCQDLILEGVKKVAEESFTWPENAMPYQERMKLIETISAEIMDLDKQRDDLADQLEKCTQN